MRPVGLLQQEHNAVGGALWFCGMTAVNALRASREDRLAAVQRVLAGVRRELAPDRLAIKLSPSERLYHRAEAW